jgi:hypothetical protein
MTVGDNAIDRLSLLRDRLAVIKEIAGPADIAVMETIDEVQSIGSARDTGYSTAVDAATAGRDAVLGALGDRPAGANDLVLLFPSVSYDLEALHQAAIAAAAPSPVVGATTTGAFTCMAQVEFGCVAIVLRGEDETRFGIAHLERTDDDCAALGRTAAALALARVGEEREHSVLLMLCDVLTPDQRALARGAYEVTTALVPLVGGMAGDDLHFRKTFTFGEGRVSGHGLVAVWLTSNRPLAVSVDHGWHPVGAPMLVTRADGPVIRELDGRPALDVYLEASGVELSRSARSFGELCMGFPVGIPTSAGGHDVRQVHQHTPDGGLVLTTGVPEQTVLRRMASDPASLLAGAEAAATSALAQLDGPARLAVVFSCCTRLPLLGDRIAEEVEAISGALGGAPAAGFYTCGEFARVSGSTGIHNASVALLCL